MKRQFSFIKLLAVQIGITLLLSAMLGLLIGLVGVLIGGRFGFPEYFGLPGYQGGGVFGFHVGVIIAMGLGLLVGGVIQKQYGSTLRVVVVCTLAIMSVLLIGLRSDYGVLSVPVTLMSYFITLALACLAWYSGRA